MTTTNLLDYLERAAGRFPDKTAFGDENESLTFARLAELARGVGAYIAERAGDTRRPVAVMTSHSAADIAAFMGALYAGCFYAPLDAGAPKEHTAARLDVIRPAVIIDAKTPGGLPIGANQTAFQDIRQNALSSDPAYAIFTSGSTGMPKAALVSHGSVINLIEWMADEFGFSERTVFAGQCPFYFDSSVQEIYSTLKCGCTTRLFPKKLFISPLKAMRHVRETGANVLPWAAAAVKLIANSGVFEKYDLSDELAGVTDVIFGGENMPAKLLNIWRRALPLTRFTNVYGPTETTVDCSYYTLNRELADGGSVPIGFPIRDTRLLLLDGDRPAVRGEAGEIYVRGAGVGLGYYGDAARTAEAFVQNPLNPRYRDTVYRTGDIARLNEHGELVFVSRADGQVKHMGGRVELGEVEAAAAALDGVRLACCAYDREKSKILLFYEGPAGERELSAELAARLPRYMCPNVVVRVDGMPATPNGKIDRLAVKKVYYDERN